MTTETTSSNFRPMNVCVAQGSSAEKTFRSLAEATPSQFTIAPDISPAPEHDLIFRGGKTIPHLSFFNFYVGGSESWSQNEIQSIDKALAAAMSDKHLNNVMAQYFPNQQITCTFKSSQILPAPSPAVVSKGDVDNMLNALHKQGLLSSFDLSSTVFNLMLPKGTILNADSSPTPQTLQASNRSLIIEKDDANSLNGLGGYHGSVHISETDGGQNTVYYAVGVYSERRKDGKTNGIPVFNEPWKNIVATFYHELNEARTDADVEDAIRAGSDPSAEKFLGWISQKGEECGDFPIFSAEPVLTRVIQEVPLTDKSGTVPVQFMYSNAVHGAEGPIATPHNQHVA